MQDFEQLGYFYLGRQLQAGNNPQEQGPLLFPSAKLNTHALCVGMTGSGKTGLGLGLLEEAAIDGIPALVIDPKGDMANLCLTFPHLSPEEFLPWVDSEEARLKGLTPEAYAQKLSAQWQEGIAAWGQTTDRIRLLRENADLTVYTPGSAAGEALSMLDSLDAPPPSLAQDFNSLNSLVASTAAALLSLLGIEADPIQSRETILISTILQTVWLRGENLSLASLIGYIQNPPTDQVGVLDWETFYPQAERQNLALRFNSLLASPSFSGFLQGRPLDIDSLLYNAQGKAKISIISIAHLSDQERMFFVTLFLNRLLAWTRAQTGSQSLRALFYMDEIFGYFPPVANPPSKQAILTLLKQARAYGLGLVLATQNPADLDYKGLANIGTWWIGRLQTERDRARLLDGLQTADPLDQSQASRQDLDQLIAGLEQRQFLMHSVHQKAPVLMESRYCLSYLKGPMSLMDLTKLKESGLATPDAYQPSPSLGAGRAPAQATDPRLAQALGQGQDPVAQDYLRQRQLALDSAQQIQAQAAGLNLGPNPSGQAQTPPNLPDGIQAYFLPSNQTSGHYRPVLAAFTETYFADKRSGKGQTVKEVRLVDFQDGPLPVRWDDSRLADFKLSDLASRPQAGFDFDSLPAPALKAKAYTEWSKDLVDYLYRNQNLTRYENKTYKLQSEEGEDLRSFKIRLDQESREARDQALADLKDKYEKKLASQEEKIRKAEQQVAKKADMQADAKRQASISLGSTVINAVFGKKIFSSGTLGRATTTSRAASRIGRIEADVERAQETVDAYQEAYQSLAQEMQDEVAKLRTKLEAGLDDITELALKPLKRDIKVLLLAVVWQAQ